MKADSSPRTTETPAFDAELELVRALTVDPAVFHEAKGAGIVAAIFETPGLRETWRDAESCAAAGVEPTPEILLVHNSRSGVCQYIPEARTTLRAKTSSAQLLERERAKAHKSKLARAQEKLENGDADEAERILFDAAAAVAITGKSWPAPVAAMALCAKPPPTPAVLVDGVLYRGGTMLLSGPSKAHKTFAQLEASIAIASGGDWLGFKTVQTPVLYLNLELQDFATAKRIEKICSARGIKPPADFHVWNLRGRRVTLAELRQRLPAEIKHTGAGLVVIDPHYKISAVSGGEENSNDSQGLLLSELEGLCGLNGAALAISHHFAKGDASMKNAIDRASGGGVFARWGDVMLTFTPHEEDEAMTVEMALRNFAPVAPFVVRWVHPCWQRDNGLNPAHLKRAGAKEKHSADDALAKLVGVMGYAEWQKATGLSDTTFRRKKKELLDAGKVREVGNYFEAVKP